MKELFTVKCPDCSKVFHTDNPEQKICPKCMEYRQPHHKARKKTTSKIPTFADISHITNVYYKIHHKYLHYGNMVNLINTHPKQCVCCGATVTKNKHVCAKCEKAGDL